MLPLGSKEPRGTIRYNKGGGIPRGPILSEVKSSLRESERAAVGGERDNKAIQQGAGAWQFIY